jgi:hypothetical protein
MAHVIDLQGRGGECSRCARPMGGRRSPRRGSLPAQPRVPSAARSSAIR